MPLFPPAITEDEFDTLTRQQLLPAVTTLCGELGLGGLEVAAFADGSLPVYAVGERLVLKLYPAVYAAEATTETVVLQALEGRLPIPTPGVEQAGEFDGWSYVVMRRLPGETLKTVWPQLSAEDKARLAPRLGEALAGLHGVKGPVLEQLTPRVWARFLAGQQATIIEHHRARRLDEAWLAQIPAFLASVDLSAGPSAPVLLHTEFMREHLMMAHDGDGWHVSGLFDFEPAMCGAAEYEFAAAGMFVAGGDADFLRALLLGYGYAPEQIDESLSRRLLAYALLHQYSNLRRYLDILPAPAEPTLDSLATAWWGTRPAGIPGSHRSVRS